MWAVCAILSCIPATISLIYSTEANQASGTRETGFAFSLFPRSMLGSGAPVKCCPLTRPKSLSSLLRFKVSDSYHYLERVKSRRKNIISTRCSAVSGMDLFCSQSNEDEIDDLLAFKRVFESDIDFVEIDVGVKGSLQMHYDNQTTTEVVCLGVQSYHLLLT